jgi:CRP-like cAMP-binding protein
LFFPAVAIDPPEQDVREFIRETFACSDEIAGYVFARGVARTFAAQAMIIRQGESAATAYLLTYGRAHALRFSLEGRTVQICEFHPGDLFGGGVDPLPDEAEVVAAEPARTFILKSRDLLALAETYGSIGLALVKLLFRQLQQAISAVGRVNAEILRLAQASPDLTIRPAPVISELAIRVGTTRETASRAVSALERRGIVRREAGSLIVVAPQRLEELII